MLVLSFVSSFVKDIIHLLKYGEAYLSKAAGEEDEGEEGRPSPLLATFPVPFIAGSIKDLLPIVELGNSGFMAKKGVCCEKKLGTGEEDDQLVVVCIVCLGLLKGSDQVRELCNCCHVFHRECVDAWIDEGHKTCPLCRSNLLPAADDQEEEDGTEICRSSHVDPWRRERMIYLFGEDFDLYLLNNNN